MTQDTTLTPKSSAERQQALRERRQANGLTRLELWAHPDDHQAVRSYAEALQRQRDLADQPGVPRLSICINTDVKMSKRMLEALCVHEANCAGRRIDHVTEDSVREFLRERFDDDLADAFRPEFLFNLRSPT